MSDRDRKPPFRRPGGKPFEKGRKSPGRPTWRDREASPDGPAILYGWHTVSAALANPERHIRKLLVTENAARRLADENIDIPRDAGNRPPRPDRPAARRRMPCIRACSPKPIPCPRRTSTTLAQHGIVLVLDQITDPHNVGAILRTAAAFAVKAIVTTARHSPEATGVLAKSASGALELVPMVLVQNLARALTALNERGFLTVGLDSEGGEDLGEVTCARPWRWCSAPKARACGN